MAIMFSLMGRSFQTYSEIIDMLKSGFPDGAFARWRTIFEITCTMSFIMGSNDKYLLAKEYSKFAIEQKSGWNWTLADKRMSNFTNKHRNQKNFYVSFNNVKYRTNYNISRWNKVYKNANNSIHATPVSLFYRLGDVNFVSDCIDSSQLGQIVPSSCASYQLSYYGFFEPAYYSAFFLLESLEIFISSIGESKDCFDISLSKILLQEVENSCGTVSRELDGLLRNKPF